MALDAISPFIMKILEKYFKDVGPELVRKKMEKAIPKIVAGMESKGMTLKLQPPTDVARDALFRLWRSVIRSGTLADLVRDIQDDKVVPLALAEVTIETPLPDLVRKVMDKAIEQVW